MVDIIDKSRRDAKSSVEYAESAAEVLDRISTSVTDIGDYSNQISSAVQEQSITAENMNENINSINDISLRTAASSEASLESENLMQSANKLQEQVQKFQV